MIEFEISANEQGQRLDRFLRKYLENEPLSFIYKVIRKDVKIGGKRRPAEYLLAEGDVLQLYLSEETIETYRRSRRRRTQTRRTFRICYEDENILAAEKPAGLLTHGDGKEKKNHLTNQVTDWLIAQGRFDPRAEKTFAPAPVNRLDRNTSGLVLFGLNYDALKAFTRMIRERGHIRKYYLALTAGEIPGPILLEGWQQKDDARNRVRVVQAGPDAAAAARDAQDADGPGSSSAAEEAPGKYMVTHVMPLRTGTWRGQAFTLAEIEIETGRTHQIRAQLSAAGFPIAGDPKYGDPRINRLMETLGVRRQLLHAARLEMEEMEEPFAYLNGEVFEAALPKDLAAAADRIFGGNERHV